MKERSGKTGLSAVRLTEEIREMGFTRSVDIVRRYLNELDSHRFPEKATVRFETPPGEQAQVDWAEVGSFMDEHGRKRKVYAFVMLLCFSRMLYVEFTLRMRIKELIRCHEHGFEYFGGWTHSILYDNIDGIGHVSTPVEMNRLRRRKRIVTAMTKVTHSSFSPPCLSTLSEKADERF